MTVLKLLGERGDLCISEIIRETGLSQDCTYASIRHLKTLGLIEGPNRCHSSRRRREYGVTVGGAKVVKSMEAFLSIAQYLMEEKEVSTWLTLPARSLEVLVWFRERMKPACMSDLLNLGVCKRTATEILENLLSLSVVEEIGSRSRGRKRKYKLTHRGQHIAMMLSLLSERLEELLSFKVSHTSLLSSVKSHHT
jgi:predicted transcriptional regulator